MVSKLGQWISYFQSSALTKNNFLSFAVSGVRGWEGELGISVREREWTKLNWFSFILDCICLYKGSLRSIHGHLLQNWQEPTILGINLLITIYRNLWKALCSTDIILLRLFTLFCHRFCWFLQKCHLKSFRNRRK